MKKTLSLIELIIAMTLMGVIVLGAMSMYYASHEIFVSSDKKSDVLNEFNFVVESIHKAVLMASGDAVNPGLSIDVSQPGLKKGIVIRQDRSGVGAIGTPNNTPFDYSDDRVVVYWFYNTSKTIIIDDYIGPGGEEYVSRCWVNLHGTKPFGLVLRDGGVEVQNLAIRLDPSKQLDPHTNPEVTSADINGQSTLFFAPISHSW